MKTTLLMVCQVLIWMVTMSVDADAQAKGGRGLRGGFGGGGPGSIFTVAANEAVQAELGLKGDLSTKVLEIQDRFSRAWLKEGGGFRTRTYHAADKGRRTVQEAVPVPQERAPNLSDEEWMQAQSTMRQTWQDLVAKFAPELKDLLTADQWKRLQQIYWQALGAEAYSEPDVIQALAMTKNQQDEIRSILDHYRDLKLAVRHDENLPTLVIPKKIQELNLEQEAKSTVVLAPDQLIRFQMMKGKGFDFAPLLDPVRVP